MREIPQATLEFIEKLSSQNSVEAVVTSLRETMGAFGVQHGSMVVAPRSEQQLGQLMLSHDLPAGFVENYDKQKYLGRESAFNAGLVAKAPFVYRSVQERDHSPIGREILDFVTDFKLDRTLGIPVSSPSGNIGIIWLVGRELTLRPTFWPFAEMVCVYAFERVRLLSSRRERPVAHLSDREREVLLWVANGKSAWEIGQILNITARTVETHVTSVMHKLGAGNRSHAVAIGMRDRLIEI